MPAYHVERTITIQRPASEVLSILQDFTRWPEWSPWLYMERDSKLTYRGDPGAEGHGYSWEGKVTGAGSMTMTARSKSELTMDLNFLKPFKSKAKVRFDIRTHGDDTEVTWHMDGKMPFFLFFMIDSMSAMIGHDYARGLLLLKELAETGLVQTSTEVVGVVDTPAMSYIAIRADTSIPELGASMKQTVPKLMNLVTATGAKPSGPWMSLVHEFDLKAQRCSYSAAIPVAADVALTPDQTTGSTPASSGRIAAGRALKVVHTGRYEHLASAWATAMAHLRHGKLKAAKNAPPFEVYVSDPSETPTEQLITEIFLPLR